MRNWVLFVTDTERDWFAVWEKKIQTVDVYPTRVARDPEIVHELTSALRSGRTHKYCVSSIYVGDMLNRRGAPVGYLSHTDFVRSVLNSWVREHGEYHSQIIRENGDRIFA